MNSNAPPEGAKEPSKRGFTPARRAFLQRLASWGPWMGWVAAIIGAIGLGQGLGPQRPVPGEAERREVGLAAHETATILAVEVQPGQRVSAGETIARLESRTLELELSVALAELEQLTAAVPAQQLILASDDERVTYRLSREVELAALEVKKMEEDGLRANAELEQLDRQITRHETLLAQRLTTARSLEALQLKRAAVAKQVQVHPQLLEAARAHDRAARSRLAREKRRVGAREVERRLAPMRAAIRAQEERIEQLRVRIEQAVIKAPMAGVVASVNRRAGETAAAGESVVTLLDTGPARVVAWVDEHRAERVTLGERALLRSVNIDGVLRTGQVVALGAAVVQAPTRFSALSGQPLYARPVYIAVDGAAPVLAGTRYDVTLAGTDAGTVRQP